MTIDYQFCTWQQHKTLLMRVRHAVFITEQQVPEELEIDQHDPHCLHILARDKGQPVATARLLNDGHIGRICVLKAYRRQGIASQLLQRLINIAQHHKYTEVILNAQISAIPFYQQHGFKVCSECFLDAGIEHKTMCLDLTQTPTLLGKNTLTIKLDSKALCRETIATLISQAKNHIALLTQNLEYALYHQSEICQSIKTLIRTNKRAKIRILCKNSQQAIQQGHCLIQLAQSFSSFIEIRQTNAMPRKHFNQSWCLIDDRAYCHIKHLERYQGTASFCQKLIVKESLDFFNHAWENAEIDQHTRRLSL